MLALISPPVEIQTVPEQPVLSLSNPRLHALRLKVTNRSNNELQIWMTDTWINHKLQLTRLDGATATMTKKGLSDDQLFGSLRRDMNFPIVLKPERSLTYMTEDIVQDFELSPGKYRFMVTYSDKSSGKPLQVTSRGITLTVIK